MPDDSNPGAPNPRDAHPHRQDVYRPVAPVTMLLIAICVAIAILALLTRGGESWRQWLYISEFFPPWVRLPAQFARLTVPTGFLPEVLQGQIWRLFTPVLMHAPIYDPRTNSIFGILHIAFNMYWLRILGTWVEVRVRSRAFLGLVVLIGIGSNLLQYSMKGPFFVGMSGVVYGLLGYIWVQGKWNPAWPELNPQSMLIMMIWLVLGFTGQLGPIANYAHLGGLIMGVALGALSAWRAGAGELFMRRREFRIASAPSSDSLHRCKACGRTERTNPDLEFRVSGADGEEYCVDHLPGK